MTNIEQKEIQQQNKPRLTRKQLNKQHEKEQINKKINRNCKIILILLFIYICSSVLFFFALIHYQDYGVYNQRMKEIFRQKLHDKLYGLEYYIQRKYIHY